MKQFQSIVYCGSHLHLTGTMLPHESSPNQYSELGITINNQGIQTPWRIKQQK